MSNSQTIRDDLKGIRYYYQRKDKLERSAIEVGANSIKQKVDMYNKFMCSADPRLYELYVYLYIEGNTQESATYEFGFSIDNIHRLHRMLIKYLLAKMTEVGGAK